MREENDRKIWKEVVYFAEMANETKLTNVRKITSSKLLRENDIPIRMVVQIKRKVIAWNGPPPIMGAFSSFTTIILLHFHSFQQTHVQMPKTNRFTYVIHFSQRTIRDIELEVLENCPTTLEDGCMFQVPIIHVSDQRLL